MEKPRPAQIQAINFIHKAVSDGYSDIVISAPTGVGKSGIGAAAAIWAGSFDVVGHVPGGYYLVTQKMLQDQLENDFPSFVPKFRRAAASLKSSNEYRCHTYGNCMAGGMASQKGSSNTCRQRISGSCPYKNARADFLLADMAITNYPYLFTEHMYVGELSPRNLIVADEAHTLEKQITGFVEVLINKETLDNWAPGCRPVPKMNSIKQFTDWLSKRYVVMGKERLDMLETNTKTDPLNRGIQDEFNRLKNHIGRLEYAINDMNIAPEDWVYWQEEVDGEWESIAKPLSAAPFVPDLINSMGSTRVYMSAYPGPKDVFCRSLGMKPSETAWLELNSAFPAENRPVHMTPVGSMGRANIDQTLPGMLRMCDTILEAHATEKGIIHTHSYALGDKIYNALRNTAHRDRVLFAKKSSERNLLFSQHKRSDEPTVIISPSMTEGYSFDDDLARFQIIAKTPYPYLGDKQVAAKMKLDKDWYTLQVAQTIIQASGRITRNANDFGDTYILDSDFKRVFDENRKFFPKWWSDALKFY